MGVALTRVIRRPDYFARDGNAEEALNYFCQWQKAVLSLGSDVHVVALITRARLCKGGVMAEDDSEVCSTLGLGESAWRS